MAGIWGGLFMAFHCGFFMNFLVNCCGWFTLFTLGSLLLKKNSGNLLWVIPGLSFGNDNLRFDSGVGFCLSFEFVRLEFLSLGLFWLKENFILFHLHIETNRVWKLALRFLSLSEWRNRVRLKFERAVTIWPLCRPTSLTFPHPMLLVTGLLLFLTSQLYSTFTISIFYKTFIFILKKL